MTQRIAALVLTVLLAAACGGDGGGDDRADEVASATTAAAAAADLPDACPLVPPEDVNAEAGLHLAEGAEIGDERRAVCAFSATESDGVGVTVGIEAGDRFDAKAETSEDALGAGDELDEVGDRALFFYSDDDIPEGVGGVLVATGSYTVDVSVQGLDEDRTREAAVAIAEIALATLIP